MTMEYKQATDALFERITSDDLASQLGCSVHSIYQARAGKDSPAFRNPIPGWQQAAATLATEKSKKLAALAAKLRSL